MNYIFHINTTSLYTDLCIFLYFCFVCFSKFKAIFTYQLCLHENANSFTQKLNCQVVFELTKQQLMSSGILAHYYPVLPICLDIDASPYGVRIVVSPIMPNDLEKPIAFAL